MSFALREFDCGLAEGRSDEEAWQLHASVMTDWLDRGRYGARIPGGESFDDLRRRFVPFISELTQPAKLYWS